ncbi:MAG: chemotaxis protein methyltransferase CheR [Actinomycetota bacterium]|nr:chemotaxis protein methyltransferase CheR [Actinomycetota bacterium]
MSAPLLDADFAAVRGYLSDAAGLVFDENRRAGLAAVVAERLAATGAPTVTDYLGALARQGGADERQRLIDRVTVQETYFFRNPPQIEALRHRVLPDLLRRTAQRDRPLTIWSAGCSTGEEAYTLAMLVHDLAPSGAQPEDRPAARIIATDVSAAALDVAARATYSGRSLQAVPPVERDRWFVPGQPPALVVRDDVRRMVELRRHNLVTERPPFAPGEVDLIVCRNVTIYFSRPTTRAVIGSFHDVLVDGGYLLLGHSETLWQVSDAFTLVPLGEAFFYRRGSLAGAQAAGRMPIALTGGPGRSGLDPTVVVPRRRSRAGGPVERRPTSADEDATAAAELGSPPAAPDQVTDAREALAAGDYRDAVRLAELAVAAEPLLAEAYVLLGHARSVLGLDSQSVEPLRKAVYLAPTAGHAHFLLAGALARLGEHAAAAVSYRAAARSLPSVPAPILQELLGGRSVTELAEVCERLARAASELVTDEDSTAARRNAS